MYTDPSGYFFLNIGKSPNGKWFIRFASSKFSGAIFSLNFSFLRRKSNAPNTGGGSSSFFMGGVTFDAFGGVGSAGAPSLGSFGFGGATAGPGGSGGGALSGGDPKFWYSFPRGKIDFNNNLDESARHLIRAIRYSIHNGGLGFVNIDAIFNNFNPNTNAGSDQGFRRVFSMDIEGKAYMMQLHFATPVSPSKNKYNPVINFDFTTDKQNVSGPYQGHYWHIMYLGGGQGAYGPFIGVGSLNGSSGNYNFIYNWIYKP